MVSAAESVRPAGHKTQSVFTKYTGMIDCCIGCQGEVTASSSMNLVETPARKPDGIERLRISSEPIKGGPARTCLYTEKV